MRLVVRLLKIALLYLSVAPHLHAQSVALDSLQTTRLVTLGRIWGAVKDFHPAILTSTVDWDSALVAAVPNVLSARTDAQYARAIDGMLLALSDPTTRVRPVIPPPTQTSGSSATARWEADSTLVVSIPRFLNDIYERLRTIAPLVGNAPRIVFDLRGPTPSGLGDADDTFANTLDGLLTSNAISAPRIRYRMQRFYSNTRETYETGAEIFRPGAGTAAHRIAFVVYADSDLPLVAWALQEAGQGAVVLDSTRGTVINPWSSRSKAYRMTLGADYFVDIRLSEVPSRTNGRLLPDTTLSPNSGSDTPLRVALDLVRRPSAQRATTASASALPLPRAESTFAETRYPPLPLRILAAFRYWNAIHYFYPSDMPEGEDWDRAFNSLVATMARARDSVEYAIAVWDMGRRLKDAHAGALSPVILGLRGESWPSANVEYVEGQPIVRRVGSDSAIRASGIKVGDVILRVDGEDATSRKARLEKYSPGTRPEVHDYLFVQQSILNGPEESTARVTVRSVGGVVRDLALLRRGHPCNVNGCVHPGPAFHLLPGNIGYADLSLLEDAMVDSMFEAFKNTSAIIFDMRGYPRGTTNSLVSRLAKSDVVVLTRGSFPVNFSPSTDDRVAASRVSISERTTKWRYTGRTAALIDVHTQSQAEWLALALSATGATLIGSPTFGGIGATTPVMLPGGIRASFPSGEWHRADGRPIQRIGIQPDIVVRPTIEGIRAGRDEVLERAIEHVRGRPH